MIMQSRLFSFCLILEVVKSLHHESAFDQELYKRVLNSDLCDKQRQFLLSSPHFLHKFREANANIPHDLSAKGVLTYTGDYFNCLSIHEHVNGLEIQGKYSQVTIDVPGHINNYEYKRIDNVTWQELRNNFDKRQSVKVTYAIGCKGFQPPDPEHWEGITNTTTITLGVCIPEPCSSTQAIDFVLDTENRPLTLGGKVIQLKYTELFYRLPSDRPISSADYIFITLLVCVLLFGIIGTVYEIKNFDNLVSKKVMSIFRCFAVHKNIQEVLKVVSSSNTIQCVDGIRAAAMAMVLWHHAYLKTIDILPTKLLTSTDWIFRFHPLYIYGVDTFLLLGGIFNVYSVVCKYKKYTFLRNLHLHLLNRLVRIYPVFCFAVLAQASILNHVGDGPQWYEMAREVEMCRLNWWPNLLFIQNIIRVCHSDNGGLNFCLGHTWYLSVDMQLFLVSTLVIMWMFEKKRTAWTALVVTIVLSLACSTIFSFFFNFKQSLLSKEYSPETKEQILNQYFSTLCRSPPYFVGMMTGYILIHLKDQKETFYFKKVWIWLLWVLTIFLLILSAFGTSIIWDSIDNQVLHNIINSNMVAVWSVSVSWIIIACHLGYGGPVNWFLSPKQWKLLSRLSYAMYIFHWPILGWMNGIQCDDVFILRTVHLTAFKNFLSTFLSSVVIAFIVTVLVEQPVLNLYKLLLGGKKPVANIKAAVEDKENISCVAVAVST